MNLRLNKFEVLKLICDKYNVPYDELRDNKAGLIGIRLKDTGVYISWESFEQNNGGKNDRK